jgi:hypothetical protein
MFDTQSGADFGYPLAGAYLFIPIISALFI